MLSWNSLSLGSKKALRIILAFILASVAWVLLTDTFLALHFSEIENLLWWQTAKGFFYLLVTSCFLFFILRRSFNTTHAAQERIEKSEARFVAFMENLPAYAFIKDNRHRFLFVNRMYEKGFGVPPEEWLGKTIQEMVPDIEDGQFLEYGVVDQNKGFSQKKETVQIRGQQRVFMTSKFPIYFGQETSLGGICIDITEWEEVIKEHQAAKADLSISHQAIEASSNGIMICEAANPKLPIAYVNPAFEKITGYSKKEVVGRNPRFLAGDDRPQGGLIEVRNALTEQREADVELRNYRKDGNLFWNELRIAPVRNVDGTVTHFVGVINDITDRKRYEKELEHKATHDTLTSLPNRVLLDDRIKQNIFYADRSQKMVAVLLLDLDRFKRINDTLGHRAGDLLLREVAKRLMVSVRECDTVARFGGDEFVVVLAELAELNDIRFVIRRILKNLARPFPINDHKLEINTSIGISLFPQDGHNAETLVQRADLAMYQAKQLGGNAFCYFSPEMTAKAQDALAVEAGLREALRQGEFLLYCQPKVDICNGRITGVEALVRWRHPEKGLLPPGYFIPVAEESGLILPIGRWCLEEACRQARQWENNGVQIRQISVNVSARQFRQEAFVQQIREVFSRTGADPRMLSIEITESMVLQDMAGALKTIAQLKELGLSLQLDDFGTGYSNFNSLRQFQVEYLKIDCSFTRDALLEPRAAAIVQSIIAIARNLGIKSVAEGVETGEQLEFLARHGCDEFQGFLFSKPISPKEIVSLLGKEIRLFD
ncbi:MAG: EAL domain-containing protein [Deltaproteobacteria bacterium]|nr:EAL domain-containing protein [Deltaproteobacteria bacterium]